MVIVIEAVALAVVVAVVVVMVRLSPRRRMQRTAEGLTGERVRGLDRPAAPATRHHHHRR
ncbi:hypothetical protein GTR02_04210 [Kineococcus sp. R8]|uniref:hypothetical protein n=1 Tax=Kineococcus siccus TaxID=2696567 RepID=UPI001411B377|nr:hypothetical protein [Kineococcus siccus]NAZ81018.1 hypothetical protein [Kineococcus siccus]